MASKEKTKVQAANDNVRTPLFMGDYKRDNAISEGERLAEVSQVIFYKIVKLLKRKK